VIGWYGLSIQVGRALGLLAVLGAMARAFIAFGTWRTAFRTRLLGVDPHEQEVTSGLGCRRSEPRA
jgi:hypothetical protein